MVLNKDRTKHGGHRHGNVHSGVAQRRDSAFLSAASRMREGECDMVSGVFPEGTDQGQDTP